MQKVIGLSYSYSTKKLEPLPESYSYLGKSSERTANASALGSNKTTDRAAPDQHKISN
jgi:hypothetical protein